MALTGYELWIILATLIAGFGGLATWLRSVMRDEAKASAIRAETQQQVQALTTAVASTKQHLADIYGRLNAIEQHLARLDERLPPTRGG